MIRDKWSFWWLIIICKYVNIVNTIRYMLQVIFRMFRIMIIFKEVYFKVSNVFIINKWFYFSSKSFSLNIKSSLFYFVGTIYIYCYYAILLRYVLLKILLRVIVGNLKLSGSTKCCEKKNEIKLCQLIFILIFRPLKNIHIVFPTGQKISLFHFVDAIS